MKYIVLKLEDREFPVIFPNMLVHKQVFEAINKVAPFLGKAKAVSAGEISSMAIEKDSCHGKSDTLKLVSRAETDDQLIHMHDYLHGL